MFAFGCRAYVGLSGDKAPSIGRVYVFEALGAIAGGIALTYLFIPFLYPLQMVLLLSGLNLLSATLILVSSRPPDARRHHLIPRLAVIIALLAVSLGLVLSPLAEEAQRWASSQQWSGFDLVYSKNSVYGNVAVVQREAQYTFYADGIPILTAPVPDVAMSEEIVHLPLLFVPEPRRALVLSGGVGGVLRELAKYPLVEIDYAELDPLLIEAVLEFPTPLTHSELSDPRLRIEHVDGRLLVRKRAEEIASRRQEGYDLVVVNLPYPSTLQLNRFYTAEFFQMVRRLLDDEGVLVVGCPGTLTYVSDELRHLNTMVYHTLRQAFPHVRPIPGDTVLWLASPSNGLAAASVEELVERWEDRGLEAQLLTASHIDLKLNQRRLDWFWSSLDAKGDGRADVNRDLHPVGLFHSLSYWNALFSPHMSSAFTAAGRVNLWALSLSAIGCALLFLAVVKLTSKGKGAVLPIAIATTGFTGMTADLVVVFAFQTLYGYIYHWIGLLITAFMAGLTLGGWLMTRRLAMVSRERPTLLKLELGIVLYWTLFPAVLSLAYPRAAHPLMFTAIQGGLFLLNGLAGFLVGAQFPVANRIWLEGRKNSGGSNGVLYACDLVGAFVGSVVVAVILIPVLGIPATCFLAAVLKLGSLLLVAAIPSRS
jgi:spermidine synthase